MKEVVRKLFSAIDKKDVDGFILFLTKNASFTFANMPAVSGEKNIREAVTSFFSSVKSLKHNVSNIWESGNTIICEGRVTYARQDGKELTFPFVNIFRMEGSLIADYRIYTDNSELYK